MRLINAIDLTIQLATCKAHLEGESEWIRGYKDGLTAAFDLLAKAPTIEAEPVKHGRWNVANDGTHFCSECGCDASYTWDDIDRFFINSADDVPDRISNYCPNCGCKMDLEVT